MNPQPPIDQNTLHIYRGNFAELRARLITYRNARPTLRKWAIPSYGRKSAFPAYERQMKLLFQDAEVSEVALGRAIRTVPADDKPPTDTIRRSLYDECNFQIYSLIYRSFTSDNSGMIDASGVTEDDGRALWLHLIKFNYEINDDNIPHLKRRFYDSLTFRQKPEMSLDAWANEVRVASDVLTSNGHPISEKEKTLVFRQGLIREDLQSTLILPARTETFEQLVQSARSVIQSTAVTTSSSATSQRIFLANSTPDAVYCDRC